MNAGTVVRNSSRETLLDAAQTIVSEQGVAAMTLENVAVRAGVTKGGLIYHFKTRELLLQALIERMVEQIESRYQAEAAKGGQTLEALLIAMIDDTFAMPAADKALMRNLLAAVERIDPLTVFARVAAVVIAVGLALAPAAVFLRIVGE